MFRGQFTHSIDTKGRVSLPARFRDALTEHGAGRFILTPGLFDPCLHVHPLLAWEELERKVSELPQFDPHTVRFRRMYVSAAVECELDRAGRVLIPQELRERARLVKDVIWAGMGRTLELWSRDLWDSALSMTQAEEDAFKQAVMEHIRI
jgi:MraZ protein